MRSVLKHNQLKRVITGLLLFLIFILKINAQDGDPSKGKELFNANCAACHQLDKRLVGPPLQNISEKRDQKWLIKWIKNSDALIKSGDKDAIAIFEEYNKIPMLAFPNFSDQDVIDILAYTDGGAAVGPDGKPIDEAYLNGKKVFQVNCAACHKLEKKLIGPPLGNISDKRSMPWLNSFIKDSQAMIKAGDKDAVAIYEEYQKVLMLPFPQLSEKDIEDVIHYTTVGDTEESVQLDAAMDNEDLKLYRKWIIRFVIALISLILIIVILSTKNVLLKFLAIGMIVLGLTYAAFNWLLQIGVDEGYQPIQPIAFSHKIHSGDNKIDCQYCHSSAKHSKTSEIPSVNVCMNCHKSISEYKGILYDGYDKAFYDGEIKKIYDAVGWDKTNAKYKENFVQKPIQWIRIHNLPDFAYFNHAQHVTAGKVECKTCHGPVEEMQEVSQFAPLTMGWCVDCHRTTEVSMANNDYYEEIHKALAKKLGTEKVTVAQMGGLECGKCHH
ncbi:MAG: c-type cytochrome [Flavobacteriaceae bacterium]|nr:c-type cytochrome [Flavobacteriaceae bacterium]